MCNKEGWTRKLQKANFAPEYTVLYLQEESI
jgi:hypothetical protein